MIHLRRKNKMKKGVFQEDFKLLDELIHKIGNIISPVDNYNDEIKMVMTPETRKRIFDKNPKCFFPVRMGNKDAFILPVCNRKGMTDQNMIALSIKMANKLLDRENVDRGMLEITIRRLERLHNKYSKDEVKPSGRAGLKGHLTRRLRNLNDYLHNLEG
jgi:hypothetical protein